MANEDVNVEKEFEKLTEEIKRGKTQTRGSNGPEPAREGYAEDLATFIEKNAADALKEAQDLQRDAQEFAQGIRERTDEKAAELRRFTNSLKEMRTSMAELRTRFLQSRTSPNAMDERSTAVERKVD